MAYAKDEGVARNLAAPMAPIERRVKMIERGKLPSPGQGPSADVRARSWFRLLLLGEAADAKAPPVLTCVEGGDPGYDETSKMVAEAALLLAHRRDELPHRVRVLGGERTGKGGVVTPAFGLGLPLLNVLRERGIGFKEHEVPTHAHEPDDGAGLRQTISDLLAQ